MGIKFRGFIEYISECRLSGWECSAFCSWYITLYLGCRFTICRVDLWPGTTLATIGRILFDFVFQIGQLLIVTWVGRRLVFIRPVIRITRFFSRFILRFVSDFRYNDIWLFFIVGCSRRHLSCNLGDNFIGVLWTIVRYIPNQVGTDITLHVMIGGVCTQGLTMLICVRVIINGLASIFLSRMVTMARVINRFPSFLRNVIYHLLKRHFMMRYNVLSTCRVRRSAGPDLMVECIEGTTPMLQARAPNV